MTVAQFADAFGGVHGMALVFEVTDGAAGNWVYRNQIPRNKLIDAYRVAQVLRLPFNPIAPAQPEPTLAEVVANYRSAA